MIIVLGRPLAAFIENKGHYNWFRMYSSDTREQVKVRVWFIPCHAVSQDWTLPTTSASWVNTQFGPLGTAFSQPLDLKKPIQSSAQTGSVSQMNCSFCAWSLPIEPLRTLHMEQHQACKRKSWAHRTAQESEGWNTISPFSAQDSYTPFLPHTAITAKHGSLKQVIAHFAMILHEIWAPPSSASFEHCTWPLAPEQLRYPVGLPAASISFLLCVCSPLSPLPCSLLLLSIAGERLPEQWGASLGEWFLNPLRESPRVLWCSGFKAQESLHLMWNIQPAGPISLSVHLLPHAAMPLASYLALLWCFPC